jgi:prepilin-type N-terminal cleavage/methylation domain-containing protein
MKKGFSLIEVILSIVIMGILAAIAAREYVKHLEDKRLEHFLNNVNTLINYAIIDSQTGYVNGTGGYCSDDYSYKDITACRAVKCADIEKTFILYEKDGNCDTTPDHSYVKNLMMTDTNGKGCHFYVKPDSSDSSIFYVFIDCSNLNSDRKKQRIEELLRYDMQSNFNVILKEIYSDAISIDNFSGGNDKDGKIAFKYKK